MKINTLALIALLASKPVITTAAPAHHTHKSTKKATKGAAATKKGARLTAKQKQAATLALREMRRIKAAVDVGVPFDGYSDRLIDSSVVFDEQLALLPEGELKEALRNGMQAYKDAHTVWNNSLQSDFLVPYIAASKPILQKYKILDAWKEAKVTMPSGGQAFSDPGVTAQRKFFVDSALVIIWLIGSAEIQEASKLMM